MQMQWLALEQLADVEKVKIDTKADIAKQLQGRFNILSNLSANLEQAYVELLDTPKPRGGK